MPVTRERQGFFVVGELQRMTVCLGQRSGDLSLLRSALAWLPASCAILGMSPDLSGPVFTSVRGGIGLVRVMICSICTVLVSCTFPNSISFGHHSSPCWNDVCRMLQISSPQGSEASDQVGQSKPGSKLLVSRENSGLC